MSLSMRIAVGAAALAALVLSVTTASACCGGCGCGGYGSVGYYQAVTVYAPVQPTYWADQGPVATLPAPVVTGPVADYVGPAHWGYRHGWAHRHGWGHRGGWVHRVGYRGYGGWGRRWGRY